MDWKNSKSNFLSSIIAALFLVVGVVLLITPQEWWPHYYDLPYMGWAVLACAGLVVVAPRRFALPLASILLLNASGDLGLYELYRKGFEYDKVIHFLSPLIAMLTLLPILGWRRAALIIVGAALAWELYEFLADTFLKTHLFGVYRHQVMKDTITDLIMNVCGVIMAACLKYLSKPSTSLNSGISR